METKGGAGRWGVEENVGSLNEVTIFVSCFFFFFFIFEFCFVLFLGPFHSSSQKLLKITTRIKID